MMYFHCGRVVKVLLIYAKFSQMDAENDRAYIGLYKLAGMA